MRQLGGPHADVTRLATEGQLALAARGEAGPFGAAVLALDGEDDVLVVGARMASAWGPVGRRSTRRGKTGTPPGSTRAACSASGCISSVTSIRSAGSSNIG